MNIEKMIELSGWDLQDAMAARQHETPEERAARSAEALKHADIIAAPFRTEAGRACLSRLIDMVRERPFVLLPVQAFTAEQQALYGAMRQGQMQILNVIRNALSAHDPSARKLET